MTTYYVDAVAGADANPGTSFGAAKQTLAAGEALLAAGDTLLVEDSGAYTLGATVTLGVSGTVAAGPVTWQGSHGGVAGAGTPTVTSATNSVALVSLNGKSLRVFDGLKFTHTAGTRGNGMIANTATCYALTVKNCTFDGCLNAVEGSNVLSGFGCSLLMVNCEVKNGTANGVGLASGSIDSCYIHANTGDGVLVGSSGGPCAVTVSDSVLYANTRGAAVRTAAAVGATLHLRDCVVRGNTSDGVLVTTTITLPTLALTGVIVYGNTGAGVKNSNAGAVPYTARNCAWGSNTGGDTSGAGVTTGTAPVTLTGDPHTSAAGNDFSLNSTAGAGAACRAAGFPGAALFGTGYADVGAAQHQDIGGGGGPVGQVIGARSIGTY